MVAPREEFTYEEVQGLRPLAKQRIEAGELPAELVPEEILTYPRRGRHEPDDRPRDYCRLCGQRIGTDVIQWFRLPYPLKASVATNVPATKPELHAACFTAWQMEVKAH